MPGTPIARFNRCLSDARKRGAPLPEAVALATADARGRPAVRYVLLKAADNRGFVFYTNLRSRKGQELARNPNASMAVYWDVTGHQIRIDGAVELVGDAEANEYWSERPRQSRIASLISQQSAELPSRAKLDAAYRAATRRYGDGDIPRPKHWTGYRLVPSRIEFWIRREPRLHHRDLYEKKRGRWTKKLLQP
jgi:pyridoxamine 5'-phosphate oxidase